MSQNRVKETWQWGEFSGVFAAASRRVVFRLRISLQIWNQIRNGTKRSVRDSCGTDFCKNPRKSASLPCPFKHKKTLSNQPGPQKARKTLLYQPLNNHSNLVAKFFSEKRGQQYTTCELELYNPCMSLEVYALCDTDVKIFAAYLKNLNRVWSAVARMLGVHSIELNSLVLKSLFCHCSLLSLKIFRLFSRMYSTVVNFYIDSVIKSMELMLKSSWIFLPSCANFAIQILARKE